MQCKDHHVTLHVEETMFFSFCLFFGTKIIRAAFFCTALHIGGLTITQRTAWSKIGVTKVWCHYFSSNHLTIPIQCTYFHSYPSFPTEIFFYKSCFVFCDSFETFVGLKVSKETVKFYVALQITNKQTNQTNKYF